MALQLNTEVTSSQGFKTSTAYARVSVGDGPTGTRLSVHLEMYISKEAYENGTRPFQSIEFNPGFYVDYDRTKDGVDTLAFGHQKAVEYLAEKGIDATILLDSLI